MCCDDEEARGVLLGILCGGVPPGSTNPDPISDQKHVIFNTLFHTRPLKSIPFSDLADLWAEIMLSLLRLERKQNNSSNPFRIRIFLFLSFGTETIIRSYTPVALSKTIPDSDQNGQSVYPFSDQNGAKTLPDGTAYIYLYSLYKRVLG